MPVSFPRSKIAALKRAYRKKPTYGYCPAPESKFYAATTSELQKLESLLRYFHVTRKSSVEELGIGHQQAAFYANVDCAAAEAGVHKGGPGRSRKAEEGTREPMWS